MKRLEYVDTTKGILIFLVVTEHIFYTGLPRVLICSFHMPAFFIISGLLINYTNRINKPFLQVLKKNTLTLIVPYISGAMIASIVSGCLIGNKYHLSNKGTFFEIFVTFWESVVKLSSPISVTWFLYTLFFAETLLFCSALIIHNKTLCILLLTGLGAVGFLFKSTDNRFLLITGRVLVALFFICAGYILSKYLQKYSMVLMIAAFIVSVFTGLWNGAYVDLYALQHGNIIMLTACSICAVYCLLCISRYIHNSLLYFMGKNTITILCVHQVICINLQKVFKQYSVPYARCLNLFLTLVVSLYNCQGS